MSIQIQTRRGTAAQWTTANPILAQGEQGYEIDTNKVKYGDGLTAWNSLPYLVSNATAPDATTSSKGIVQLAGDLGGSAAAPTVPQLATKSQYAHNPRPATVNDKVVTIFATGHGWTIQGTNGTINSNLNDTSKFCQGTQSVKLVSDGAGTGQTITLRSPVVTALDWTGNLPKIWVEVEGRANLNRIAFTAFSGSTSNSYSWTFDHGTDLYPLTQESIFIPLTLSFADATISGSPSRSNITQFQFSFSDTGVPVTVRLNGVAYRPDGSNLYPNGVVTINFDDGWDTQYTNARPILEAAGFRANINVIAGTIGTTNYMTTDMLQQLHDEDRHEINCHAYTLANHNLNFVQLLATQGVAALDSELAGIKQWLTDNGFLNGADILALPNGAYNIDPANATSVMTEAKKFFSYVRTIYSHQGQYVETVPPSNPYAIRAISGISGFTGGISATAVQAYIDKVKAQAGWGILTFHRIVTTAASTNECSIADFQTIVSYLASAGVAVRTVGDVMRNLDTNLASKAYVDSHSSSASLGSTIPASSSPTPSAGSASTASRSDHVHPRCEWAASDNGLIAWAYDPALAGVNSSLPNAQGTMQVVKLHNPTQVTVTNIILAISTAGATLTSGQNFATLYNSTGALVGTTADQATNWQTNGAKIMGISGGPVTLNAGDCYVGFWSNGTTMPSFSRASSSAIINVGLSSANSRFGIANTGLTTATPGTLGTVSVQSLSFWAGLS
jgi:peptidoglycan/xylan/chitin deacetylase (PgdA/CDA1 family)